MDIAYDGLPIRPTRSVYHELKNLGMDLYDVLRVLEDGYDCRKSRREEGVIERCLEFGDMAIKVVAAESYEFWSKQEVYAIIHVGKFKVKK